MVSTEQTPQGQSGAREAGAPFRARDTGPGFGHCPDSRMRRRRREKGLEDRRDEFEEDALEVKRRDRVKELVASPSEKTVGREKGTEERRGRKGGDGGNEGTVERTGVWE